MLENISSLFPENFLSHNIEIGSQFERVLPFRSEGRLGFIPVFLNYQGRQRRICRLFAKEINPIAVQFNPESDLPAVEEKYNYLSENGFPVVLSVFDKQKKRILQPDITENGKIPLINYGSPKAQELSGNLTNSSLNAILSC